MIYVGKIIFILEISGIQFDNNINKFYYYFMSEELTIKLDRHSPQKNKPVHNNSISYIAT